MNIIQANEIAIITENNILKGFRYTSEVFKQDVLMSGEGDYIVDDKDYKVYLNLAIPVHTFESFFGVLLKLRKEFDVVTAYSKKPISYENLQNEDNQLVGDENYAFAYWDSVHMNVLYSDQKPFNVFLYLNDFDRYVNLYVTPKKKKY